MAAPEPEMRRTAWNRPVGLHSVWSTLYTVCMDQVRIQDGAVCTYTIHSDYQVEAWSSPLCSFLEAPAILSPQLETLACSLI